MAIPIALRKSTDCTFYLQGSCKKGEMECEFRHNPLALNPAVKDCAFWFNGRCTKGQTCPFRHLAQNYGAYGMPRTPAVDPSTVPCVFYAQGKCMKGDACPYSHSVTLAPGVNAADSAGAMIAEEGELQGGQAPREAMLDGAADAARKKLTWRAQAQVAEEPAAGQESMVLQFDEEDEDADAGPNSDRRRSTPGKGRRAPAWEVRSVGEQVRGSDRPEPAVRQIGRERREEKRGTPMEQRLGRRRARSGLEEAGDRAPRRVVATTSPSVKDRLGAGASQASQGSNLRVQARVNPRDSQRERMVVDLQRDLLLKGADRDRWNRNRTQGEPVGNRLESRLEKRTAEKAAETAADTENGAQRKFGAEAKRRWAELQKQKRGASAEPKGAAGEGATERPGGIPRMRDLVELEGHSSRVRTLSGPGRSADRREGGAEKKEGPRILTLEEIRAAKKRSREAEEAGRAAEETAAREGKRPAPVKLNRAGLVASAKDEGNTGERTAEEARESERQEGAETEGNDMAGNGTEGEDANGGEEEEGDMNAEAEEGDYEDAAGGEEGGSEYEDEEGDEGEEGGDDIASLMKKYGAAGED